MTWVLLLLVGGLIWTVLWSLDYWDIFPRFKDRRRRMWYTALLWLSYLVLMWWELLSRLIHS
jgi:hypothetical protein